MKAKGYFITADNRKTHIQVAEFLPVAFRTKQENHCKI